MQLLRNPLSVWALVPFTALMFGSAGLMSKFLIDNGVDAFTVTGVPGVFGAAAAWLIGTRRGEITRAALVPGLVLGVTNSAIPPLFFNLGFETLSAGLVTLIITLGPSITAAVAHLVFRDERFNRLKGLGLLVALVGVTALVSALGVIEGASYRGAAWTSVGALIGGTSAVLARWYAVRHGGPALLPTQLTAAGLTPLIAGLVFGRQLIPDGGFLFRDIAALALMGVIAAYVGLRAMMLANQRGTTGQVSMVAYMLPLIGVVGGIIFFDEVLTAWIVLGGALILGGVALGGRGSRPTEA